MVSYYKPPKPPLPIDPLPKPYPPYLPQPLPLPGPVLPIKPLPGSSVEWTSRSSPTINTNWDDPDVKTKNDDYLAKIKDLAYDVVEEIIGELPELILDILDPDEPEESVFTGPGDDNNNIFKDYDFSYKDYYDGKGGIDLVSFIGSSSDFTIAKINNDYQVNSKIEYFLKENNLSNIERLEFSDTKIALDTDGNAGQAAKIFAAVLGKDYIYNREIMGIGIKLIDSHEIDYEDIASIAIKATGKQSAEDIVTMLWTNVVGSAPTDEQAKIYIDMLNSGSKNIGELGVLAADSELNQSNINLVGLKSVGIEYIDVDLM